MVRRLDTPVTEEIVIVRVKPKLVSGMRAGVAKVPVVALGRRTESVCAASGQAPLT